MREIDMLDLRWHKGEPTWEIIDELLEMIDASPSEEEIEDRIKAEQGYAYYEGSDVGYANGYDDGCTDGHMDGYTDGFRAGKSAADD